MIRSIHKQTFNKTASLLLALGTAFSPVAAWGQGLSTTPVTAAPISADSALTTTTDQPLVAQASPGTTVLQGRVSNVDTLTRDILRDEIKLSKFNLNYRLNAAKQGYWKGWRQFFLREAGLGLSEANLIKNIEYRGRHLHHPARNRRPVLANGINLQSTLSFFFSGSSDIIELGYNLYDSAVSWRKGFSQTQARKFAAGLVANIDKKIAERDAAIRQEPASDAETAQLQGLEGKVLADLRDMSIAEFERYHMGASRVLARENSFYLLDGARCALGVTGGFLASNSITRGHPRMNGTTAIMSIIVSGMIMIDPILARLAGNAAAAWDARSMHQNGLPAIAASNKLHADFGEMKSFASAQRTSEKPEVLASISRVDHYDANEVFYTSEVVKNAAAIRRGNRAAIQNMGMGLVVGGTRLTSGILPAFAADTHDHSRSKTVPPLIRNSRITNEYSYTGSMVYLPGVSIAILDSWRIRLTGELNYWRQKRNHTLPAQVIRARLAQLDQMEAKI
jgi:hypothetical protein